jgi:hypothetical protein
MPFTPGKTFGRSISRHSRPPLRFTKESNDASIASLVEAVCRTRFPTNRVANRLYVHALNAIDGISAIDNRAMLSANPFSSQTVAHLRIESAPAGSTLVPALSRTLSGGRRKQWQDWSSHDRAALVGALAGRYESLGRPRPRSSPSLWGVARPRRAARSSGAAPGPVQSPIRGRH